LPSPSERVAKVEKITIHTKHLYRIQTHSRLTKWFTAENNNTTTKTIAAFRCFTELFKLKCKGLKPFFIIKKLKVLGFRGRH